MKKLLPLLVLTLLFFSFTKATYAIGGSAQNGLKANIQFRDGSKNDLPLMQDAKTTDFSYKVEFIDTNDTNENATGNWQSLPGDLDAHASWAAGTSLIVSNMGNSDPTKGKNRVYRITFTPTTGSGGIKSGAEKYGPNPYTIQFIVLPCDPNCGQNDGGRRYKLIPGTSDFYDSTLGDSPPFIALNLVGVNNDYSVEFINAPDSVIRGDIYSFGLRAHGKLPNTFPMAAIGPNNQCVKINPLDDNQVRDGIAIKAPEERDQSSFTISIVVQNNGNACQEGGETSGRIAGSKTIALQVAPGLSCQIGGELEPQLFKGFSIKGVTIQGDTAKPNPFYDNTLFTLIGKVVTDGDSKQSFDVRINKDGGQPIAAGTIISNEIFTIGTSSFRPTDTGHYNVDFLSGGNKYCSAGFDVTTLPPPDRKPCSADKDGAPIYDCKDGDKCQAPGDSTDPNEWHGILIGGQCIAASICSYDERGKPIYDCKGLAGGITCDPTTGEKGKDKQGGIYTAIGCIPTKPDLLLKGFLKFSAGIGGGIALLLMILGAFRIITSAGNPESVKKGQEQFQSAVIGLLFIIFSVLLLQIIGVDILSLPGFGK